MERSNFEMDKSIVVKNLSMSYENEEVLALDSISLTVNSGELFGLIGPDGAGKTSLFRILCTLLLPTEGSARICGKDVIDNLWEIRSLLGYMPGKFSLYPDLSIQENLQFFAAIFGTTVEENYDLIKDIYVQIEPFKDRPAGKLSGGMKQKLALCCALVHEPKVLLLDEPTTGVDPVSRREFWNMLDLLKAKGITILVSTPYMDEAARCDRIALMQDGRILEMDTYDKIIEKNASEMFAVKGDEMYRLLKVLRTYPNTKSCFAFGESHHLTLKEGSTVEELKQFLKLNESKGVLIEEIRPNIEDIFMELSTQ